MITQTVPYGNNAVSKIIFPYVVDIDGKHGRRQIASMAVSQYNLIKTTID